LVSFLLRRYSPPCILLYRFFMRPQNLRPFTHLSGTSCAEAVDTSGVAETSKMQRFDVPY
jgi:hypothetical protein